MVNDPKFRTIARISKQEISRVISVYMHMMTCASNATERGRTEGWSDEDVATALDIEISDVVVIRDAMQGRVIDGDRLTGWEKRQPIREDDGAAARAKAWRDAKKAEKEHIETQPNATERKETLDKIREDTDKEEKKSRSKASAQPSVSLPDWIPAEPWAGYMDMRKKKRKEPTARAIELLTAELEKMRQAGQDIAAVLNKSTVNGWTDVYPIKPDPNARGSPGSSQLGRAGQVTAAAAQRLMDRMSDEQEE